MIKNGLYLSLTFLCFSLFFSSCKKSEDQPGSSDSIVGYWLNPLTEDSTIVFERPTNLMEGDYGIVFKSGGKLVERKNIGWCGTPPITYGDFDGQWYKNDSMLYISVGYWGGMIDYQWNILSVGDKYLTVQVLQ